MRLVLAALIATLASLPPAYAGRVRDGFGTSSRCHCDRYLNPHSIERGRPAPVSTRGPPRETARRY